MERDDILRINQVEDIDNCDYSIKFNLNVQICVASVMILLFLFMRRKNLWLYSPNTKNKQNHPAFTYTHGIFSWILPIFFINDVQLISIIGLDSFMMLQVLKLLYRCFFIICILITPLFYIYFTESAAAESNTIFLRFNIEVLKGTNMMFVPILYVYIITFLLFYLIYVYYKKFITLRQTYLRSPVLLTALGTLKRLSFYLDDGDYVSYVNMKSRTVFLTRIPEFVENDIDLRIFVDALGCGVVDSCALLKDLNKVDELIDKQDGYIRDFEGEVERSFRSIISEIKMKKKENDAINRLSDKIATIEKNEQEIEKRQGYFKIRNQQEPKNSCNKTENDSNFDDKENSENGRKENVFDTLKRELNEELYEDAIEDNEATDEDVVISKKFVTSKNKYIKKYKTKDSLTYKLSKIKDTHDKLVDYLKKIDVSDDEILAKDNIVEMMNANNRMYVHHDLNEDIPFFCLKQIFYFRRNYHLFSLDLPLNTKSAFVTFTEQRSANIICQSLISSKIFSCKANPAPDPDDIIWENINRGEIESYFKKIFGDIIFIIFCVVFYTLVFALTNLIQLEQLIISIPSLKFIERFDIVKNSFNSVVVPGCYNAILSLAPYILTILIYYQGVYSYSLLYLKLMIKYGYFLLFNGFIALLISGTFLSLLKKIAQNRFELDGITKDIGKNLRTLSLFFLNTIIQRMIVGNALILFKPVKFLFVVTFDKIMSKFFKSVRSRRNKMEAMQIESINFGVAYPIILIVFPMAISYAVISPLILIVAGLYFYITYFVYKHEFIYCLGNDNEAGGVHWHSVANQLIMGIFIFQILTICQFTSFGTQKEAFSITPILFITYMFKKSLNTMFKKSTSHYPLNEQEEQYMDKFTENVISARKGMVNEWDQTMDPNDPDAVEIIKVIEREFDLKNKSRVEAMKYPYRGIVRGITKFMLPKGFFKKLKIVNEEDGNDELEIFKEAQ